MIRVKSDHVAHIALTVIASMTITRKDCLSCIDTIVVGRVLIRVF